MKRCAMKAILKVTENNTYVKSFIFYSFGDARRFLNFVNIYYNESGCGNGYDAYWPNYLHIPYSRFLPFIRGIYIYSRPRPYLLSVNDVKKNKIRLDFIQSMLYHILQVRFAANEPDFENFKWSIEDTKEGIKFNHEDFPPQVRPQVGDMYRIPRSCLGHIPDILEYSEGRVIEDLDDIFKVIPCQCLSNVGLKGPQKIFYIEAERVIKINDWLNRYK